MLETLEFYTDASVKTFPDGRVFSCAGAFNLNTLESSYVISPDSTNNRGELLGIYIALKIADSIIRRHRKNYKIVIYSDSQFSVYGLTRWLDGWVKYEREGLWRGSNGKPVKNQELFKLIMLFIEEHDLTVQFLHCKAHVCLTNNADLQKASRTFYESNGYEIRPDEAYKISYYNNMVDQQSRKYLENVNPDMYPRVDNDSKMYVLRGYAPIKYMRSLAC